MERYLPLPTGHFFEEEEDLKFVFPGRREGGKGKGRGLTEEGDFILAVSRDVWELVKMVLVVVVVVVVVVLTQGERGGDKRKEEDGYRT